MFLVIQGFQYQLGDFQLRVGKVVSIQSESLRGIVMEVITISFYTFEKPYNIYIKL